MSNTKKYNTKAKKEIIEIIKEINNDFSIKELEKLIRKAKLKIARSTIYRIIDELYEENIISKFYKDNSNTSYYYYLKSCDKENHFYLKCRVCGNLIHVDCDCLNKFLKHSYKEHDFLVDDENILISGKCKNCI